MTTVLEMLRDRTDGAHSYIPEPFGEVVDGVHWSIGTDGKQALALRADLALAGNPRAKFASILGASADNRRETTVEALLAHGVPVQLGPLVCPACKGARKVECRVCSGSGRARCYACQTPSVVCHSCGGDAWRPCECEHDPPSRYGSGEPLPVVRMLGVDLDARRLWVALQGLSGTVTAERVSIGGRYGLRVQAPGSAWVAVVMGLLSASGREVLA